MQACYVMPTENCAYLPGLCRGWSMGERRHLLGRVAWRSSTTSAHVRAVHHKLAGMKRMATDRSHAHDTQMPAQQSCHHNTRHCQKLAVDGTMRTPWRTTTLIFRQHSRRLSTPSQRAQMQATNATARTQLCAPQSTRCEVFRSLPAYQAGAGPRTSAVAPWQHAARPAAACPAPQWRRRVTLWSRPGRYGL